ncbi:MAG: hypothetical protein EOP05_07680 [Proteobacteria bacterium]|nr:MAG: hypothetical protein EOP05_07680 [Pseudomonadota bacterium]
MKTAMFIILTMIGINSQAASSVLPDSLIKYSSYDLKAAAKALSVKVVLEIKTVDCDAKSIETRLRPMAGDPMTGMSSKMMIETEVVGSMMSCEGLPKTERTLKSEILEIPVDYPGASIELIVREGLNLYSQN